MSKLNKLHVFSTESVKKHSLYTYSELATGKILGIYDIYTNSVTILKEISSKAETSKYTKITK